MSALVNSLSSRREEFEAHLSLANALEFQVISGDSSIGETTLTARHLLTMKSGLVVHLYNIVEAIMTQTTRMVGRAMGEISPRDWKPNALREWLRKNAPVSIEGTEDSRLEIIHKASQILLTDGALGQQELKKPSGTWSDKIIYRFAQRLDCQFTLPAEMHQRIAASPAYGDQTPLVFLAERRNAIAHGRRSFEEGANDLTLVQIKALSDVTLDYLTFVIAAFEAYVDTKAYKMQDAQ